MNKKGFTPILVLLVLMGVLVVAGGIWYYEAHQSSNSQFSQNQTSVTQIASSTGASTSTSGTAGLQTYTNSQYGISFNYPSNGSIKAGQTTITSVTPAITYFDITVSLPFLILPHPEDWTNKNLDITFNNKINGSCSNWFPNDIGNFSQKTINGTTYAYNDPSVADTSGMSSISKQREYYIATTNYCVKIIEKLSGYGTNEGPAPTTKFSTQQEADFIATEMKTLDDIVSTLQLK